MCNCQWLHILVYKIINNIHTILDEKKTMVEVIAKSEASAERRHQEKMTVLKGFLELMTNVMKNN
jgi:hypothetical protein